MIYVSSSCIKHDRINQILEEYVRKGITNIELSGGTQYYPEIEEDLLSYKQKYNINYVCHAYFPPPREDFVVNLASCNDEIYNKSIEHYMNCIEMLKRIDCHVLSIHAGFYIEILPNQIGKELTNSIVYDKEESLNRFCEAYENIVKNAKKYGITMYLENNVLSQANYERFHKNNYLMMTDFDGFNELKKRLDFNLLLDLAHLHVSSKTLNKDFSEQCKLFGEFVKWLHISDNNGITDQHLPLKRESIIASVLSQVYKTDMNITLETIGNINEIMDTMLFIEGIKNGGESKSV